MMILKRLKSYFTGKMMKGFFIFKIDSQEPIDGGLFFEIRIHFSAYFQN